MLTPQQLYYSYSNDPCEFGGSDFVGRVDFDVGKGTPYDLPRLANFLKQLKYPCVTKAKHQNIETVVKTPAENASGIKDTGKNRLCLPFRFLQTLDVEAFSEVQPDIRSGTSHAIRNAVDITRACNIGLSGSYDKWEHRTATEYMQFFGFNHLSECLMLLGPDLVSQEDAYKRGTGCGDLDCLPRYDTDALGSALGASFTCRTKMTGSNPGKKFCTPCDVCAKEDGSIDPNEKSCCTEGSCEEKMNWCCGDITGERDGVYRYYNVSIETTDPDISFYPLKHVGILKRKSYGGYVNLLNNTGSAFYSCGPDLFLRYFQTINNYDYAKNIYKASVISNPTNGYVELIDRVRTISFVQHSDRNEMIRIIKDLLFNGYGIVLMTNVGFPNTRESDGLSYPDKIWYHSFAIIGYDDRKVDYEECVFLLANTWGKWNDGGHPKWGPIPDGSFLVTQTHLAAMIDLFRSDKSGCRTRAPVPGLPESLFEGCLGSESACDPWGCSKYQRAAGMVFALSMTEGFPRQILDYTQFYNGREMKQEDLNELYFEGA